MEPENRTAAAAAGSARRYALLDTLRGLTLCSMAAYHACWDAVNLFGAGWSWYEGRAGMLWQQSICWSFILLAGFCWPLGSRPARRGLVVFAAGAAVTAATLMMGAESRIVFGVLTFLGSAMLLMIPWDWLLRKSGLSPAAGLAASALLFAVLRGVNGGTVGIGPWRAALPQALYRGLAATYVGFQSPAFYSADYFPLLPWMFLFLCGYFACRCLRERRADGRLPGAFGAGWAPAAFLGRHSLLLYLVHQPLIFAVLTAATAAYR
jgi:uncharacterized membrane protein